MPRIAVVGAGGIGGPLALSLAADGAAVTIFDPDTVEASNLHRQLAFSLADLGKPKASTLAAHVRRRGGQAEGLDLRWSAASADRAGADLDVIVDGSDDAQTKFEVAAWASRRGLPSVIAGALGVSGNVFVSAPGRACLGCLFEQPPSDAPTCADAGVLGPVVASIAGIAAMAALQLASGDRSQAGAVWILDDALRAPRVRRVAVAPRPGCASCGAAAPHPSTEGLP
jgi:molybdopterin-synthase adenylyltransferase